MPIFHPYVVSDTCETESSSTRAYERGTIQISVSQEATAGTGLSILGPLYTYKMADQCYALHP